MPRADSSPARRVEHRRTEADQLLGRARIGDRDEDPGGEWRAWAHAGTSGSGALPGRSGRLRGAPALHEVRLGALEGAGLALHAILGLLGRHVPVLDHEAADPAEVDRHERRDQGLERVLRVPGGHDEVVDDLGPHVVRELERADRLGHLLGRGRRRRHVLTDPELGPRRVADPTGLAASSITASKVAGRQHRAPQVGEGHGAGVELRQQPQRVHVQGRRVDDPLEPVGRHVVAALDVEPVAFVLHRQPQDRAHDLAEHRPEVGARVLGVVDLGAEARLADGEPAGKRRGRHPDVDAELADVVGPVIERQVVPDEVAADPEVATDRLADAVAVEGPGERVGDGVRDRAVVLVARVQRRHEVVAALEDRPGQQLDPLGHDRPEVRVDHDERLHLERRGDLEDRAQRRALATDAVDLGVGQADARELVARSDEQDLLDVVGRLGVDDDASGAVRRARVRIDDDGPQVREVLDEACLRGAHHVADGRCVLEAWDADHDVGFAESGDLVPHGRSQGSLGHRAHRTTPHGGDALQVRIGASRGVGLGAGQRRGIGVVIQSGATSPGR